MKYWIKLDNYCFVSMLGLNSAVVNFKNGRTIFLFTISIFFRFIEELISIFVTWNLNLLNVFSLI